MGERSTVADLMQQDDWPWRQSLHAPGCRYARLRAKSPTYGAVTVLIVDKPSDDRIYDRPLPRTSKGF